MVRFIKYDLQKFSKSKDVAETAAQNPKIEQIFPSPLWNFCSFYKANRFETSNQQPLGLALHDGKKFTALDITDPKQQQFEVRTFYWKNVQINLKAAIH